MCICITELRFGLLAQSCMGCRGTIPLISNLVRSIDDGVLTKAEFDQLPEWAQEYLEGSSNELYEVAAFPPHLHGLAVATVAKYLLEVHRAVLLATTGTAAPASSSSTEASKVFPAAAATQDASPGPDSCPDDPVQLSVVETDPVADVHVGISSAGQQHAQHSSRSGRQGALLLSSLTLNEVLTRHTSAYIITSDVRVVLDIMESSAEDFDAWTAVKQQEQQEQQEQTPSKPQSLTKHSMTYQPAVAGAVWRARAAQHSHGGSRPAANNHSSAGDSMTQVVTAAAHQHLQKPGSDEGSRRNALVAVQTLEDAAAEQHPQHTNHSNSSCMQAAVASLPSSAATQQATSLQNLPATAADEQLGSSAQPETATNPANTASSPSSRKTTAEPSSQGHSLKSLFPGAGAAPASGLKGLSSRSLLAALPAALGHAGASSHEAGAHARRRRLGAIQVTRGAASLRDGPEDDAEDAAGCMPSRSADLLDAPGTAPPSKRWRTHRDLSMQQLYHTRDWGTSSAQCLEAMAQPEVHVEGHLLVCSCDTPPAALACLLKPLRAKAMAGTPQPVVVLSSSSPAGPEWEELARLSSVYHVQGSPRCAEALLRASADTAATAVVLLPWSQDAAAADADDVLSADMVDAGVLSVVRRLRGLNPHVQVYCELAQNQSLRFLDPLGSLLDGCAVDEAAAAAASPAFMCGAVLLPLMDTLMCQAINNRGTPHILSSLLSSWHRQDHRQDHRQAPTQLSGRQLLPVQHVEQQQQPIMGAADLATGAQQAACVTQPEPGTCTEPNVVQCRGSQFMRQEQRCGPAAGVLMQVPVHHLHCATFGELFGVLLKQHGMLCCGLYRRATMYGNPLWYVYTNPHKDTMLYPTDRAFVLAAVQLVKAAGRWARSSSCRFCKSLCVGM